MRVSIVRRLACALAVSALGACASSPQYGSASAAGTVDLSMYPAPALSADELQWLRGLSDANIIAHLAMLDSLELVSADSALRLSKNGVVLDYAKLMHHAHEANLDRDKSLAKSLGLTPAATRADRKTRHLAAALDSLRMKSDMTLDQHYIMSQVELHQHILSELETLQTVAKDEALRDHIATMIPAVRDHLSRAHAIAISKGYEKKR